jgi:hypothetical protein
MDRIYVRLATMVEPAPLHKLLPIENVCKIALTVELMRLLAVRQSLNQLFNMFVASSNLMLDGGGGGCIREGVELSHNGTHLTGSQCNPYPSYTIPVGQEPIRFAEFPPGFIVVWKGLLQNHRGDPVVLGFYYGSQGNV